jgi:signal transduction histidine kinase
MKLIFKLKLSDKILLTIVFFVSVFVIITFFIFHGSLEQILILGGAIYVISFLITYILSRQFSSRLLKLTFLVEEMAAGNFSRELRVKGKDEIAQLAHALNELISRIKTGVAQDVSRHQELAQAKTDFVALASHQLRTPLSIIKWYIDFLLAGDAGKLTTEQKHYLKEVYRSNERLIELVNALLDVSRIDVGTFAIEPEPTDIIDKAEEALARFMPEIKEKKIKIEKEFDRLPLINLDPRLTKIVFENIISNAVKYTPSGGIIRLEIKKTDKDVLIKISDTGCGIPREQQPKIFTKLFRADNVKRIESVGTGLGLYIVKAVIEKSGGKIWFQSPSLDLFISQEQKKKKMKLGKNMGTTFFITIPLRGMQPKLGTKKLTSGE